MTDKTDRGRMPWDAIPDHVRQRIAPALGSPVTDTTNAHRGFSPGSAGCCRLADGRRYFIKAAADTHNPDTPAIHRREACITAQIPRQFPVPEFIDVVDAQPEPSIGT